ncbi:low-temperature-induced 65 kDa protein-like [Iris pallida]|uniref:Low-temperature-induced 65 kDa protein-like n=1 Tax=Iris pallida TaxID=29817 RepID=A0AAX6HAJ1_IRIPA|nr:low-temperature-induced 65 kDa protein-like [Iris pallida]
MAEKQVLRHVENPTGEHLPSVDEAHETHVHWSTPVVPVSAKSCDHEDEHEHHHEHHHKKSILGKVKHKAKKWRQTLTKKKHGHEEDCSPTSTCSSAASASLDEHDEAEEADPEYHGAPMYESETAPSAYKDNSPKAPNLKVHHRSATPAKEPQVPHTHEADKSPVLHHLDSFKETSHNSTAQATADKVVAEFRAKQGRTINTNEPGNNKTLSATATEMLTPSYNLGSDATHMIASKIQSPRARDEIGAKMMWDKSVQRSLSVKEYLRNKLEPGEEDRALSEVITEAMSPRKAGPRQGGETSVVEKVRRALSQLLGNEEMMGTKPTQVNIRPHQGLKPLQAPERSHQNSPPVPLSGYVPLSSYICEGASRPIPVSTNSYAEVEELGGRRLQAYAN